MDSIKRIREDSNLKLRIRVRSGPRVRANLGRIRIRANSCEFEPASLEGALFQLPPLGLVEDLREAVGFGLGVRVQCVFGGRVLQEEAVFSSLEHDGWVVGEGAVLLPDRGDGVVADVGHGVVEVADALVGEFMLRIQFVVLGDALLPVDVPLLQVCPDVGHMRPAVVHVSAGLRGVRVEEGRQLMLRMPEVMEHASRAVGVRSSSVWGCCWKPQATAAVRMAVSKSVES